MFAFEVELSNNIEKAMDRLLFAFNQWNSNPRIIVPEEVKSKVTNRAGARDRDFSERIKVYHPQQIFQLFEKKKQLKQLEKRN